MTKAKAKGSSSTAARSGASKTAAKKPSATKAAPAKKASAAAPSKTSTKAKAAPVKASAKAPAKAAPKAAAKAPAPEPVAPPPAAVPPTGDLGLRPKKKTKRGAPPMLPRRLNRRPPPPVGPGGSTPPPPPKPTVPGSLHTPARAPEGAEQLKVNIIAVKNDLAKLRAMKRTLLKQFWEVGLILARTAEPSLYKSVGYGSWESFVEREVERDIGIGRTLADELRRIVKVFNREAAEEYGLEKLRAALKALNPEAGLTGGASNAPASTLPTGG